MIFRSDKKKKKKKKNSGIFVFSRKKSIFEKIDGLQLSWEGEVEVGTLMLGNDKNNVIVNKVLSYFKCFSSKFEVYIARFRTK